MAKKSETVTQDEIGNVLTGMVSRFNEELFALTEDELRTTRWYWKYDDSLSVAYNIYKFSDALEMYRSSCRRWEEHHNGHVCVVERVRDKYLMPKIKEFEEILHGKIQT